MLKTRDVVKDKMFFSHRNCCHDDIIDDDESKRICNNKQCISNRKFLEPFMRTDLEDVLRPHIPYLCRGTKNIKKLHIYLYSKRAVEDTLPWDWKVNGDGRSVCESMYFYMMKINYDGVHLLNGWGTTGNCHLAKHIRTKTNWLAASNRISSQIRRSVVDDAGDDQSDRDIDDAGDDQSDRVTEAESLASTADLNDRQKKYYETPPPSLNPKCANWTLLTLIFVVLLAGSVALIIALPKEKDTPVKLETTPMTMTMTTPMTMTIGIENTEKMTDEPPPSSQNWFEGSTHPPNLDTVTVATIAKTTTKMSQPSSTRKMTSRAPLTKEDHKVISSLTELEKLGATTIQVDTVTISSLQVKDLKKRPGPSSSSPAILPDPSTTDRVTNLNIISPFSELWFVDVMTKLPHVNSLTFDVGELCRGSRFWGETVHWPDTNGIEILRLLHVRPCPFYMATMSTLSLPNLSRLQVYDSNLTLEASEPLRYFMGGHMPSLKNVTFCRSTFCDDCGPYFDPKFRSADFSDLMALC